MKWLLSLAGGPLAWLATGWSWILSVLGWCVKNWKVTLPIVLLCTAVYGGVRWERAGWETKWAARDAEEALIESEHLRIVAELDHAIDAIEKKAAQEKAAREKNYEEIEKRLKEYEERHRNNPCGIGDDGLQLILDAIAARRAGAGARDAGGARPVR